MACGGEGAVLTGGGTSGTATAVAVMAVLVLETPAALVRVRWLVGTRARTVRLPPVASWSGTSASLPPSSVSFFLTNPPAARGSSLIVALRLRRPTRICQCWSTPACIDIVSIVIVSIVIVSIVSV